ncbi:MULTISPECIES: hypothetical protein [unclassified Rathayibacter]|uniref:glycosyl-4,4'-diaponeurosporenoate acyltransferase CrtO family protein n=1 Tax=unclassified Rathayibacter TaxID=2609250 RepID=UPI0006F51756|nr:MULTISPECIES: hypothetical protein [unclassified Rathayibacter]KQQ05826.1 hypothetical protein ASF42_04560 [Rathayibacter sp. Leaf294]KQS13683.1 hypothetical protein ASG06_04570 [Rathayibacter sp. Leaf185]
MIRSGREPLAVLVQPVLTGAAALTLGRRAGPLDQRLFTVGPREPAVLRALGVGRFGRMLDRTGWNRRITRLRAYDGTRAGLAALDQHTRRSELVHLVCTAGGVAFAAAALLRGARSEAVGLLATTIVLQLYPALLQRLVRSRIQTLRRRDLASGHGKLEG